MSKRKSGRNGEDYLAALKNARRGHQSAQEILARDPKLHATCAKFYRDGLYRGRDKELSDLESELILKILANIGKVGEFQDLGVYYSWVKEIARNLCYGAHRKDKYLLQENIEDVSENPDDYFACPPYDDMVLLLEIEQILREQTDTLTVDIFTCVVKQELTVQETADLLGCSRETVYRHLRKMKEILVPYLRPGK